MDLNNLINNYESRKPTENNGYNNEYNHGYDSAFDNGIVDSNILFSFYILKKLTSNIINKINSLKII